MVIIKLLILDPEGRLRTFSIYGELEATFQGVIRLLNTDKILLKAQLIDGYKSVELPVDFFDHQAFKSLEDELALLLERR